MSTTDNMNVAIIGGGLSGLSCSIILERFGLSPTIFESKNQVGGRFANGEAMMSLLSKPIQDPIKYLSDEHGIFLKPISSIRKLTFHSQNEKAVLQDSLGFTNIRGNHPDSFEKQLLNQVKSKIICNSIYTYEQLSKDFTHIVVAAGDPSYTAALQEFRQDMSFTIMGAIVEGKFDLQSVDSWMVNSFTPMGFSYLIPLSENEASIALGFPDYARSRINSIDELWQRFIDRVCTDMGQNLRQKSDFQIEGYIAGRCGSPRIGNTIFTGNCLGTFMPAFGYGQFPAMLSGIYAAWELCGIASYEKLAGVLLKSYENSLNIRRVVEQLSDNQLDMLMKLVDTPIFQNMYRSKYFNFPRLAGRLLKPLARLSPNAN